MDFEYFRNKLLPLLIPLVLVAAVAAGVALFVSVQHNEPSKIPEPTKSKEIKTPVNLPQKVDEVKQSGEMPTKEQEEIIQPQTDKGIEAPRERSSTSDTIVKDALAITGTVTTDKVVALTFDHSWGNTFTPKILDILKQNNIKVTFFLMGPWATQYPETSARIAAEGHEIASHGYRHENYGEKTDEWIREDFAKSEEQIRQTTGVKPILFRPPNGHYSTRSLQLTYELGYKSILWNIDSWDWMNPGQEVIINRVTERLKPGAIILLHASDTPIQTADALPIILRNIESAGYRIITVGELLSKHSEGGMIYH